MNTFKIILLSLLMSFSYSVFAQIEQEEPSEEIEEKIESRRVAYISTMLELTSKEAQAFWPTYNEYRENQKALKKDLRAIKKDDSSKAEVLVDKVLELEQQQFDLRKAFARDTQKLLGSERTLKLLNVERGFKEKMIRGLNDRKRKKKGRNNR